MTPDYQAPFALPPGATELVLARHGSADHLLAAAEMPLLAGQRDPPLSPAGRSQAEQLARRLALEPVAALFVTPLRRTAQTADPLARALGLQPVVVPELREIHLGEWELAGGLEGSGADPDGLRRRVLEEESWDLVPGGERTACFAERVDRGLALVASATGPGRVAVVVCHGGVVAQACRAITGSRPFAFFAAQNGSITRIVRTDDQTWSLRVFNDIAHLSLVSPA